MHDDTALLQLVQTKGLGYQTLKRVLKTLATEGRSIQEFVMQPVDQITRQYGLKPDVAQAIKPARPLAERLSDELHGHGIRMLMKGTPDYPDSLAHILGDAAPAILFAKGNLDLLARKAVGFAGSRRASEKGLHITRDCAALLAELGVNAASGYAHGVDLTAHRAALDAGGTTTFVLAEGILRFAIKPEIAELLTDDNHVVVSEFLPRLPWNARNAMQRNRTICALSNALIIIESGLSGGTFAAGKAALALTRPLFVVDDAEPAPSAEGNGYFLEHGGIPLRRSRDGAPNLKQLFKLLEQEVSSSGRTV